MLYSNLLMYTFCQYACFLGIKPMSMMLHHTIWATMICSSRLFLAKVHFIFFCSIFKKWCSRNVYEIMYDMLAHFHLEIKLGCPNFLLKNKGCLLVSVDPWRTCNTHKTLLLHKMFFKVEKGYSGYFVTFFFKRVLYVLSTLIQETLVSTKWKTLEQAKIFRITRKLQAGALDQVWS